MTKWQIGSKIFTSWDEVEEFLKDNEECSIEDVLELAEEEAIIDDSGETEENLDETEVISEEEARGIVILSNWNEIEDEELKKLVLSLAMGDETGHHKKFSENTGTKGAIPNSIKKTLQKLSCPESRVCPFCYREISTQEISSEDNIMAKILHAKREHPEILSACSKIVGITKEREPFETSKPTRTEGESGVKMEHQQGSPNPEACSESEREELAKRVVECPDLREQLYRKWIQRKQRK